MDLSEKPNTSPPVSKRSEGRAAIYGLLGAIIGGLATFGGAYWTGHQTESLNQSTSERNAYVAFITLATQYEVNLTHLPEAVGNANSYGELRNTMNAEISSLISAGVTVAISSSSSATVHDAHSVFSLLTSIYVPLDPKSLNTKMIANIQGNFGKKLGQFESDVETELGPAYHR